jgi:hypothetical protein
MRHSPSDYSVKLLFGQSWLLGPHDSTDQLLRELPHLERHVQSFSGRLLSQDRSHSVTENFIGKLAICHA